MFLLKNILGIGSKVTTPTLDLYFVLYFLANSNNFWCPECKPSKLPIKIIDFLNLPGILKLLKIFNFFTILILSENSQFLLHNF